MCIFGTGAYTQAAMAKSCTDKDILLVTHDFAYHEFGFSKLTRDVYFPTSSISFLLLGWSIIYFELYTQSSEFSVSLPRLRFLSLESKTLLPWRHSRGQHDRQITLQILHKVIAPFSYSNVPNVDANLLDFRWVQPFRIVKIGRWWLRWLQQICTIHLCQSLPPSLDGWQARCCFFMLHSTYLSSIQGSSDSDSPQARRWYLIRITRIDTMKTVLPWIHCR